MFELTPELALELKSLDTPTVCNALELVVPERRGHGYTTWPLICTRPQLEPLVGLARTATIRAAQPNALAARDAQVLSDSYYAYIDEGPKPSVIVIEDLDDEPGYGSFWGEVNSNIHRGLGCGGVITSGSVRDLPDVADGFQMMANRVGPSHAFVHVVEFSQPVAVAGMEVKDGDLVHADQHGAVVIPSEAATQLKAAAELIGRREHVVIAAAQQPGFDAAALRQAQAAAGRVE